MSIFYIILSLDGLRIKEHFPLTSAEKRKYAKIVKAINDNRRP